MRLAVIEAAIRDHTTNNCISIPARPLVVAVSPDDQLLHHKQAIADKGHLLATLPSGKVTCTICNMTRPVSDLRFWCTESCVEPSAAQAVLLAPPPVLGCPAGRANELLLAFSAVPTGDGGDSEPEQFRGTMQQIKVLSRARAKLNFEARTATRANIASAQSKLVEGLTVLGTNATQLSAESVLPAWAILLHSSHELWHAGGAVWCGKCGAVLSAYRKSRLTLACGELCYNADSLMLAKGSNTRLQRLMQGKCCVWPIWPDGMPKSAVLVVRRHFGPSAKSGGASSSH